MSNAGIPGITINYNGCFVFMGFGGVMMLMGFLGCCGSICEISFMLCFHGLRRCDDAYGISRMLR